MYVLIQTSERGRSVLSDCAWALKVEITEEHLLLLSAGSLSLRREGPTDLATGTGVFFTSGSYLVLQTMVSREHLGRNAGIRPTLMMCLEPSSLGEEEDTRAIDADLLLPG
jgi:hypothetical protein